MTHILARPALAAAALPLLAFGAAAAENVDCVAPSAWFPHEQTPPPDDNADFNSNCAFHQWSWQAFLALTKATGDGRLVFQTLIPASDVIDGQRSGTSAEEAEEAAVLRPRSQKQDVGHDMGEIRQAGSLGLLVDQNGRSVYYSQYVNDTFFDFVVTENQFNVPANLLAAPADLNYPIGALTLKAAWKVVADGEDTSGFYTTEAVVQLLTTDATGEVVVDPEQTAEVTVALVGLHVVGIVKGHPEAIWASFEHVSNAPEFGATQMVDDPVSDTAFTFYAANSKAGECNQNNAGFLELTDPEAQTLTPVTQVCRQFPFGGGSATNVANIASMNASVHAQLAPDSLWQNYMETGAIWFSEEDALKPEMLMEGSILTGSTRLSNSVIETFTQKTVNENQCFACHNTQAQYPEDAPDQPLPGKNLNISHVVVSAYVTNLQTE